MGVNRLHGAPVLSETLRRQSVRLGLIGAGRWGRAYLRTIESLAGRCELTALSPRRPAGVDIPDGSLVTSDWSEVIDACDAVIIASPPTAHAEALNACLEAAKPCIVEKPLCLQLDVGERLHDRIRRAGLPVLVNHTHLFNPAYRTLKRELESRSEPIQRLISEGGALGPFNSHTPALWDWCPHDFSLCLDLMQEFPYQVQASGGLPDGNGQPEAISASLEFSSGASAWVHAGRSFSTKRRSLAVFTPSRLYVWDDMAPATLRCAPMRFFDRYLAEPRMDWDVLSVGSGPPMLHMLSHFLDGVSGGDRSWFGTELALQVMRLLHQCEESVRRRASTTETAPRD